jgi:hypothetical protein
VNTFSMAAHSDTNKKASAPKWGPDPVGYTPSTNR